MSRKADPKVIGLFVVGAFAFIVVGIAIFGSGQFFTKRNTWVLFFDGSVGGLQVGAPVNFRGVRLGQVTDIRIELDPSTGELLVPVYIETDPGRIVGLTDNNRRSVDELINDGLRAELGMQSFVTGQLSVELDFKPDTPVRLLGGNDEQAQEFPTLPSDMEKLKASITRVAESLSEIPVKEMVNKVETALNAASKAIVDVSQTVDEAAAKAGPIIDEIGVTVSELHVAIDEIKDRVSMKEGEAFYTANEALQKLEKLIDDLDSQVVPLSTNAQQTLGDLQKAAKDASAFLENIDNQVQPLSTKAQETLTSATGTFETGRSTLDSLNDKAGPLIEDARKAFRAATVTLEDARSTLASVGKLSDDVDAQVAPLSKDAADMLNAAKTALDNSENVIADLRQLLTDVDNRFQPIADKVENVLDNADVAMTDARAAISGIRSFTAEDSPTVAQANITLREISRAATALRQLADYLERNPNAILTGKN